MAVAGQGMHICHTSNRRVHLGCRRAPKKDNPTTNISPSSLAPDHASAVEALSLALCPQFDQDNCGLVRVGGGGK